MGLHIPRRTKEVVFDRGEDGEPFRAMIVTSLTFEEIDAIPLNRDATFGELFPAIASYVVWWNASALNRETGEYEALPAPADAGWEILRKIEPLNVTWLAMRIGRSHLEGSDPKSLTPIGSTPGGPSENDSDSPTTEKPRRRRNQTATT